MRLPVTTLFLALTFGVVVEARVSSSLLRYRLEAERALAEAVRQWKYEPGPSFVRTSLTFELAPR